MHVGWEALLRGFKENFRQYPQNHDARQILGTSDRVYRMHEGQVVVSGSPQDILDSDVARKVYLGEGFSCGQGGAGLLQRPFLTIKQS